MSPWPRKVLRLMSGLGTLSLVGCAHQADFLAGMVQVGPDERAPIHIATADGEQIKIEGEAADELRHIPQAVVRVQGQLKGRAPERHMAVERYQIVDAGQGVIPHVGVLRWDAGRLVLLEGPEGPILELRGPGAKALQRSIGARAWVVGPILGQDQLEVLAYGILRAATP